MMERTGIVEERARQRILFARYRYVAPQDRGPRRMIVVAPPRNRTPRRKSDAVMAKFAEVYAEHSGKPFTVEALWAPRRTREASWARHVCIRLVRDLCGMSMPQIGKAFQRDHTSVMYALLHASDHMVINPDLKVVHDRVAEFFTKAAATQPLALAAAPSVTVGKPQLPAVTASLDPLYVRCHTHAADVVGAGAGALPERAGGFPGGTPA